MEETAEKTTPSNNKKAGETTQAGSTGSANKQESGKREEKDKKSAVVQSKGQYDIPQIAVKSAKELASKIDVKFNNETNTLDFKTIVLVVEQSTELAKVEYIKLTYENRKGTG